MFYGYVMEGAFLGLTIEGVVKGTGVVYNGLPEVVAFYDISGARVGATATIPCTELTIAQLNADFNKYLNMQVKLTGVEVSEAFSNSDKNGKVKQGADELAIYVKTTEAFEAAQGSKADLVVFPAVFNANKQAYVWAADDYKPSVVGGQITLASKFTVNVGETVKLGATTNSTATIKYASADETIATVSADGVVTGVKEGEVEITASIDAVEGFTAAETKTTIVVKPAGTEAPALTYTLQATTSTHTAYAQSGEVEVNGLTWMVNGNTTLKSNEKPIWRIGGKNIENTDRFIYGKSPISGKVSKIEITHVGAGSKVTVNSVTVFVYDTAKDAADATNEVSSVAGSFVANGVTTFDAPEGQDWTGKYYRIVYNLSVSGKKNQGVDFLKADFWK